MTTPTMDEPLTPAEMERLTDHMSPYDRSLLQRALFAAQAEGRKQGLGEAKEAFRLSDHMHKRNTGLMLCISDLSAVIVRMSTGIDHLSEIARQWEPDHSSGADRRGWALAKDARDDALKLLKEHAAAIEQLRGK